MKKGAFNTLALLAMLIIALFFLKGGDLNSIIPTPTPSASPTPTIYPTPSPSAGRPDLSAVFYPYVAAFTPEATCGAHGGTWYNTHDRVGCFDATIPFNMTTTCDTPAYQAALYQCQALGGHAPCGWFTIGCYYA